MTSPNSDTRLWCLHHIGPDEVHPAPDFDTAWRWAEWANKRFADAADISRFTVAIWPWSPGRHADGIANSIADWTLPNEGFDRDWCVNMAKQEAGYEIGAGVLAIDPLTPPPVVLPDAYWSAENGNFYDRQTRKGMGNEFYREWFVRRDEFPTTPENPS